MSDLLVLPSLSRSSAWVSPARSSEYGPRSFAAYGLSQSLRLGERLRVDRHVFEIRRSFVLTRLREEDDPQTQATPRHTTATQPARPMHHLILLPRSYPLPCRASRRCAPGEHAESA